MAALFPTDAELIAELARVEHQRRTGHAPKDVTVVVGQETVVVTLHGALTPAELVMSRTPGGAAQVQDYHRQLFANSTDGLRAEIERILGRNVSETVAEIDPATGAVVHAFTSGSLVQVYQLNPNSAEPSGVAPAQEDPIGISIASQEAIGRAEDEGLPPKDQGLPSE